METLTVVKVMFVGGLLVTSAAAVLLALAVERAAAWIRSHRHQLPDRRRAGLSGSRPESGHAQPLGLPVSDARWRILR
jgi:hypothetical protein